MIIGDMSPGVPGLRGRKPFPLTVHPGDPDPPLGGSGTQAINGQAVWATCSRGVRVPRRTPRD